MYLDGEVLLTQGHHHLDGRQPWAVLVALHRGSHGILQAQSSLWDPSITSLLLPLTRMLWALGYLEELKEHVVEMRRDVDDADGLLGVAGCREEESAILSNPK